MRKRSLLSRTAAISAAMLLVAGCSSNATDEGDSTLFQGPIGQGEGTLNVLAWPGYAEDGSTDPAADWVTPFEEATGCQVNVKTFGTSDEAVQLFQSGGYDVVSASGDATLRLIASDSVQPVNTDLLTNYKDVWDGLKNQAFNSVDGQMYGAPHGRGANLLSYNLAKFPTAPDSWSLVWETDSPAAGKISGYDSPIYIADAALYLMATQPELGILDPYSLDQTQFDAAMALLEQQKGIASDYWSDYLKNIAGMADGSVLAGTTWQVNIQYANAEGEVVGGVKPVEGSTGWSDTWMIAKNTEHLNCSYLWLDHIISPEANAAVAEWFGEAPANSKSCDLVSEGFCDTYHANDEAYWGDVYFWTTPTEKCLDGRTEVKCVPYSEWVSAWSAFRSS